MTAWAWGISRAIDYLASSSRIDPKRIALQGISQGGYWVHRPAGALAAGQDRVVGLGD